MAKVIFAILVMHAVIWGTTFGYTWMVEREIEKSCTKTGTYPLDTRGITIECKVKK